MSEQNSELSVPAFLDAIAHKGRREDAFILDGVFQEVTGWQPKVWRPSIIGYGRYDYTYDSGHSGTCQATGFAPRTGNMVIYIMPGYTDFSHILKDLGPHKIGKACLYLGRLNKIDLDVLRVLIKAGLEDLQTRWPVRA